MPCYDERSSASYNQGEIDRLTERNNKLMRVICKIDSTLKLTNAQLALCGEEVVAVVLSHRKKDVKRNSLKKR